MTGAGWPGSSPGGSRALPVCRGRDPGGLAAGRPRGARHAAWPPARACACARDSGGVRPPSALPHRGRLSRSRSRKQVNASAPAPPEGVEANAAAASSRRGGPHPAAPPPPPPGAPTGTLGPAGHQRRGARTSQGPESLCRVAPAARASAGSRCFPPGLWGLRANAGCQQRAPQR